MTTMLASAQAGGLETLWFLLISILWLGYFVLEGFDFGVGMLLRFVGKTTEEKRAVIHTIGPVWDANEVWLLTAGGATFAAFPELYATLFSGAYLVLFLILFALIARGVAFEFWGKEDGKGWRSTWEWAIFVGSALPALLWGAAWANIVRGLPVEAQIQQNTLTQLGNEASKAGEFVANNADQALPKVEYAGSLLTLLNPYALLGGVVTLLLFLAHGAVFLQLRLKAGALRDRVQAVAAKAMPAALAAMLAFVVWSLILQATRDEGADPAAVPSALQKPLEPFITVQSGIEILSLVFLVVAVVALAYALLALRKGGGKVGTAFGATTLSILGLFIGLFIWQYPNALVGTLKSNDVVPQALDGTAVALTLNTASSTPYTLKVMTIVAVIFVPIVLAYTAWTYWVFRARIGAEDFGDVRNPGDLVARRRAERGDGRDGGVPETS